MMFFVACGGSDSDIQYGPPAGENSTAVTGEKPLQFRVKYTSDHLPEKAQKVLKNAHGGFAVDRRSGKGETYFALPGAGILRISSDLSSVKLLDTPPELEKANLHNTTIWYDEQSRGYLTFPANNKGRVFTTDLDGNLVHTLTPPSDDVEFDEEKVASYFQNGGDFVPTDVEQVNDRYYITTGYSDLDYVLTGNIQGVTGDNSSLTVNWNELAFGGKGTGEGQFGTGHGITRKKDELHVSDRKYAEIERFSSTGEYLSQLNLPEGSYPCDVDFGPSYDAVPCLHGPNRDKGAPIYLMKGKEIVSTIMIKEDLGVDTFQHIHNAVLRKVDGRLYIIAQSWNPGDFVILEQVKN